VENTTIAGIKVSPIGLGTGRLASLGAGHSFREAARLLDEAFDLGVTFVDTADTYGSTTCERWLGKAMHRQPHRFVVATKFGLATAHLRGPLRPFNQPAKKILQRIGQDHYLEPDYVRRSLDGSLRRLGRERIEFYFLHEPPPGVERMDALFEVLEEAKTNGKIAAYGVSGDNLRVIDAVTKARKCPIAQTAINPRTTEALMSFLASAPAIGGLELVANSVIKAGPPPSRESRSQVGNTGPLPLTNAQLLVRHAAAVEQVRVVLIGTSKPIHLAEGVAALATPTTCKDLLA
jgi:aryl-alcohol dehydrogenase-like predicted oxidoreductase